jgi:Uma2 family endonuclease
MSQPRESVSFAWLVDPRERTLESYQRDGGRWSLLATHRDDVARIAPFAAIEFELTALCHAP